jgi:hypothetical protein|tara:strand:+ start:1919 stop:2086 length:168 start_codon:yes stop_codon:yes gene_type:complete
MERPLADEMIVKAGGEVMGVFEIEGRGRELLVDGGEDLRRGVGDDADGGGKRRRQ